MFAVIKTGGKQYLVEPGKKIRVEKLKSQGGKPFDAAQGEEVIFDDVLLLEKQNKLEIGSPKVESAKVVGKVIKQGKAKKVTIIKFKAKKRYKKKQGHRQFFTEVEITKI